LEWGIEDPSKLGRRILASKLHGIAEKYGVGQVLIEDFQFLGGSNAKKASHYVVERMRYLIGYLEGFFSARYLPVILVSSSTWKSKIKKLAEEQGKSFDSPEKFLENLFLKISEELPKSKRMHVLSALGMILANSL